MSNWTSTQIPCWQDECERFREPERFFVLYDVTTPEHERFVSAFRGRHNLIVRRRGTTVIFFRLGVLAGSRGAGRLLRVLSRGKPGRDLLRIDEHQDDDPPMNEGA